MKGLYVMPGMDIMDHSPVGYALLEAIRNGQGEIVDFVYRQMNDAYCTITGVSKHLMGLAKNGRGLVHNARTTQRLRLLSGVLDGTVDGYFENFSTRTGQWHVIHMHVPFKDHICCLSAPILERHVSLSDESRVHTPAYRRDSLVRTMSYQAGSLQDFLTFAVMEAMRLTGSQAGRLFLTDESGGFQRIASDRGNDGKTTAAPAEPEDRKVRKAFEDGAVIIEPPVDPAGAMAAGAGSRSEVRCIYVPIHDKGATTAVLWLGGRPSDYGTDEVEQVLLYMEDVWNVAQRRQVEELLVTEKQFLDRMVESINEGIVSLDRHGHVITVNRKAETLLQVRGEAVRGESVVQILHPVVPEIARFFAGLPSDSYETLKDWTSTVRFEKDGEPCVLKFSTSLITNGFHDAEGVVLLIHDITKETLDNERIVYISYHDMLTGLYNRRYFEQEIQRLDRDAFYPISLLLCDLNGLKLTNDAFGHQEGDRLLVQTAELFRRNCRPQDLVARWGGDEFVMLLPNTGQPEAERIAQHIREACGQGSEAVVELSLSIGIATKRSADLDFQEIITLAENNMHMQKLGEQKSQRSKIIDTIRNSLRERHSDTEAHAERLIKLALSIAGRLGLSQREKDDLKLLALLHDIGKIGVSDSILKKRGPLSPEEWAEMRKHPYIGYRIASATPELRQISAYILHHHEKYDGTGYPVGLSGGEIPLLSRIIAVADSYDAMTSDRTYRKAMSPSDALAEMNRCRGTQFDPVIVDLFVAAIGDSRWEEA